MYDLNSQKEIVFCDILALKITETARKRAILREISLKFGCQIDEIQLNFHNLKNQENDKIQFKIKLKVSLYQCINLFIVK